MLEFQLHFRSLQVGLAIELKEILVSYPTMGFILSNLHSVCSFYRFFILLVFIILFQELFDVLGAQIDLELLHMKPVQNNLSLVVQLL
mmetsp:Transcript_4390/g.4153  ORF Transcript_4390/g.4153 Transcript_4390/m.4153 type:complete len:88 (+) Transcript_4390:1075-1338(+)